MAAAAAPHEHHTVDGIFIREGSRHLPRTMSSTNEPQPAAVDSSATPAAPTLPSMEELLARVAAAEAETRRLRAIVAAASEQRRADWSSLYSDALRSCFTYLRVRDLHSAVNACRGWRHVVQTCRPLEAIASFGDLPPAAAAAAASPFVLPPKDSVLKRHVGTLSLQQRLEEAEMAPLCAAFPHVTALRMRKPRILVYFNPTTLLLDGQHIDQLAQMQSLRTLQLEIVLAADASLEPLLQLAHLTDLTIVMQPGLLAPAPGDQVRGDQLSESQTSAKTTAILLQLAPQLHALALTFLVDMDSLAGASWPLLTSLDVPAEELGCFLPQAPNLTSLKLREAMAIPHGFSSLPRLTHLRSFLMEWRASMSMEDEEEHELLAAMQQCTQLTALDVSGLHRDSWCALCSSLTGLQHIRMTLHQRPEAPVMRDDGTVVPPQPWAPEWGVPAPELRLLAIDFARSSKYGWSAMKPHHLPPKLHTLLLRIDRQHQKVTDEDLEKLYLSLRADHPHLVHFDVQLYSSTPGVSFSSSPSEFRSYSVEYLRRWREECQHQRDVRDWLEQQQVEAIPWDAYVPRVRLN